MIRVTASSVINACVETVWQAIRDFNALPEWQPAIAKSEIEGAGPSDRIGCVRSLELAGGGGIREQLLALSDVDHSVTYTILSSPLPIDNYISTLRVMSITDGDRSFVEWTGAFDVSAEQEAAMRHTIGQGVYQTGLDALKKRFGG